MPEKIGTTQLLFGGILGALILATIILNITKKTASDPKYRQILKTVNSRISIWWAMCGVFAIAALTHGIGSIIMFAITSFLLLREFITITPTRKADHHTCFWAFFIILPLQYYFLWINWYGFFIILIPVYAFLFVPLRTVLTGDTNHFMERTARIQWALMICVYCISHAPGLLKINFSDSQGTGLRLLLYLCLIVQMNDLTQIIYSQMQKYKPDNNSETPNNITLQVITGILVSALLGLALAWATPFSLLQSAAMAILISIMGTTGNLCYAAIAADRGKPGVVVVHTRPSAISRLISLCFAAPMFFHIVRFYFTSAPAALF
jgi:phosphatidate cytidylyltransferase